MYERMTALNGTRCGCIYIPALPVWAAAHKNAWWIRCLTVMLTRVGRPARQWSFIIIGWSLFDRPPMKCFTRINGFVRSLHIPQQHKSFTDTLIPFDPLIANLRCWSVPEMKTEQKLSHVSQRLFFFVISNVLRTIVHLIFFISLNLHSYLKRLRY